MKDYNAQKQALVEQLKAEQERIQREIAEAEAKQLEQIGAIVAKAGGDQLSPKELLGAVLDIMKRADERQREEWVKLAEAAFPEPKPRARRAAGRPVAQPDAPAPGSGASQAA
jgi:hypothetical protein